MSVAVCSIVMAILATEVLLRVPFAPHTRDLLQHARRAVAVIQSAIISDHWKEKAVLGHALRMARHSIILGGWMTVIAVICLVPILVAEMAGLAVFPFMMSPQGIAMIALLSAIYALIRKRLG